ncbi:short-chain dehydrogenase/reductase family protein [Favolaschia claudopus]|uniref:Short-chain dehydrogenase/reductase family protein n=1 Tax=Favolaschia claudopus TaxID=2862362 RepID=A0AAV9ZIN4_9AGAR
MSSPSKFTLETTAEEVAATFVDEIKGKNVLVTGTSVNGIGCNSASSIAKYANLVIVTGYNEERLKLTEEFIKKETPTANVRRLVLDLSSLSAVRKAAAEVNAYPEPIHVLISNAAAAIGPFKLTVDNLESQMATSHVGPFLFTKLIANKLLAAGTPTYVPRIVYVSSEAHFHGTGVNFDTLGKPDKEKYHPLETYCQIKSAGVSMAMEVSKRSGGEINGYSCTPGVVLTNMNQKPESLEWMQMIGVIGPDGKPDYDKFKWKSLSQGAATVIAAAFDPSLNDAPGSYLTEDSVADNTKRAAHSADPAQREKLWSMTEEIVGEKFTF